MKSAKVVIASVLALGCAGSATAGSVYVQAERSHLKLVQYAGTANATRLEGSASSWQARVGYDFNENFALEGTYTTGLGDDIDFHMSGIFIRASSKKAGSLPVIGIPVNIYARIGKSYGKVRLSNDQLESIDAFSVGLGLGFHITDNLELTADWTSYGENDGLSGSIEGYRLHGFSGGLRATFGGSDD